MAHKTNKLEEQAVSVYLDHLRMSISPDPTFSARGSAGIEPDPGSATILAGSTGTMLQKG